MKYESYRQLDSFVDQLFIDQKYDQALDLLDIARRQFPDFLDEILWYQALIYIVSERPEKCLDSLEEMLANGFFNQLEWNFFDPLRDDARFKAISEKFQELRTLAQKNARMQYRVLTPPGYTGNQQYPLFIALHGNGHWLDIFQYNWKPDILLEQGFIVLYVQSSQMMGSNSFSWTESYEVARRDIKAAFDAAAAQYSVDSHKVLIGGFSGGGMAAIEAAMANTLPVRGFITLCASTKPESFTPQNVHLAKQRALRGVMLKGENEGTIADEQQMLAVFDAEKFPYQFIVNPGIGHTFPADFDRKLLAAINFVME